MSNDRENEQGATQTKTISEMASESSAGPWYTESGPHICVDASAHGWDTVICAGNSRTLIAIMSGAAALSNAAFIAHARTEAPRLESENAELKARIVALESEIERTKRRKLPDERRAVVHKVRIGSPDTGDGIKVYITPGLYEDGTLGELFLLADKEGSLVSGLLDTIATLTSIALQHHVPVDVLADKFSHMRFEPAGRTDNPEIPIAKSVVDYIFRYIGNKYGTPIEKIEETIEKQEDKSKNEEPQKEPEEDGFIKFVAEWRAKRVAEYEEQLKNKKEIREDHSSTIVHSEIMPGSNKLVFVVEKDRPSEQINNKPVDNGQE